MRSVLAKIYFDWAAENFSQQNKKKIIRKKNLHITVISTVYRMADLKFSA